MSLDSVMQLQGMNEMMKAQLNTYPVSTIMIFGIAGGNGLEHIQKDKLERVYGVDINSSYLQAVTQRYPELNGLLECLHVNLMDKTSRLPKADLVIANLVIEYIGYECFQRAVRQVNPIYVSCIIQINTKGHWVSNSPYLHVFDCLDQVHHEMDVSALEKAMLGLGYQQMKALEHMLPNKKKLVQIDFRRYR